MKPKTKSILQVLSFLLLATLLASCGNRTKFVAPEIAPPSDLIPAYVPEGFELIKGYQIKVGDFEGSRVLAVAEGRDEDRRIICDLDLPGSFFNLQSPAGNDILGVHYQDGDSLLLITKSSYPGGSLDGWQATFEGDDEGDCDCDCGCCCMVITIDPLPFPHGKVEITEVRSVGETQVAIVDHGLIGATAVFMRGDHLLTVQGDISLEETLKVVESLLQ